VHGAFPAPGSKLSGKSRNFLDGRQAPDSIDVNKSSLMTARTGGEVEDTRR
jgi:hypothetical protein